MPASLANARTLQVFTFASPSLQPPVLPPLVWPAKDPEDVLDYALDLGPSLLPGEAISAAVLQQAPAGLTIAGPTLSIGVWSGVLSVIGVLISGGANQASYAVAALVTTTQGRTLHLSASLPVVARAAASVTGAGLSVSAPVPSSAGS